MKKIAAISIFVLLILLAVPVSLLLKDDKDLERFSLVFYSSNRNAHTTTIYVRDEDNNIKSLFEIPHGDVYDAFILKNDFYFDTGALHRFDALGSEQKVDIERGDFSLTSPSGKYSASVTFNRETGTSQVDVFGEKTFSELLPVRSAGYWRPVQWSEDEKYLYLIPHDDPHDGCEKTITRVNIEQKTVEQLLLSDRMVCVMHVDVDGEALGAFLEDIPSGNAETYVFASGNPERKIQINPPQVEPMNQYEFSDNHEYMAYYIEDAAEENVMAIYDINKQVLLQKVFGVRFLTWKGSKAYFATVNQDSIEIIEWNAESNTINKIVSGLPNGNVGIL